MAKIINNCDRYILSEGRDYQMGFAFLKKTKENTYRTVQPISACKDYLNDVVWAEHTNKGIYAHGLNYKRIGIFDGKESYMAISILPRFNGNVYDNYHEDVENLKKNIDNLQKFMNFFDKAFGLKPTKIEMTGDNLYLVKFDYEWSKTTYGISLFSLLLRLGQFYKKGYKTTFIKEYGHIMDDVYMAKGLYPIITKLIKDKKLPNQDLNELVGNYAVHDCGILSYKTKINEEQI